MENCLTTLDPEEKIYRLREVADLLADTLQGIEDDPRIPALTRRQIQDCYLQATAILLRGEPQAPGRAPQRRISPPHEL